MERYRYYRTSYLCQNLQSQYYRRVAQGTTRYDYRSLRGQTGHLLGFAEQDLRFHKSCVLKIQHFRHPNHERIHCNVHLTDCLCFHRRTHCRLHDTFLTQTILVRCTIHVATTIHRPHHPPALVGHIDPSNHHHVCHHSIFAFGHCIASCRILLSKLNYYREIQPKFENQMYFNK